MRSENLFFSAIQFLFVVAMTCTGLSFLALPFAPHIRFKMAGFLTEREDLFIPLGIFILLISALMGIGFYSLQKKAYLQLKMSPTLHIEKELLKDLLEVYWKKKFPDEKLKTDILLHSDQKIEFVAQVPHLDPPFLTEVEKEMSQLLLQHLGYKRDFFFTLIS